MATKKVDYSPKKTLADSTGELWLEMKYDEKWLSGRAPDDIIDEIVALAKKIKLGKYSGRSEGPGAFDVSFKVKNRKEAATPLRELVKLNFPGLVFCLSDEYECKFVTEQETTLLERLARLEHTAMFLHSEICELRAHFESEAKNKPDDVNVNYALLPCIRCMAQSNVH